MIKKAATLYLTLREQWLTSLEWIIEHRHPTDAMINLTSAAGAGTAECPGDRGNLWALSAAFPENKLVDDANFHSALSFLSLSFALGSSPDDAVFVGKTMNQIPTNSNNDTASSEEPNTKELVGGVVVIEIDPAAKKKKRRSNNNNNLIFKARKFLFGLLVFWKMKQRYGFVELLQAKEYEPHRQYFNKLIALGNTIDQQIQALHLPDDEPPYWYLKAMSVHPNHQRQGIGTSILSKLNGLADRNNKTCCLTTAGEGAIRLYKSLGYKIVFQAEMADPKGLNKEPIDAVVMIRRPRQPSSHSEDDSTHQSAKNSTETLL